MVFLIVVTWFTLVGLSILWSRRRLPETQQLPVLSVKKPLPSNAEAFLESLQRFDTCSICLETYDANHVAAQIPTCKHVFGLPCLQMWVEAGHSSSNTCPMCKQSVFLAPVSNHNDDEYDHGRSYQFMQRLWSALIEYRTRIAGSASADGRPDDAALLHVLHALDYNEIRWVRLVDLELDPLAQLTFTAQTMYDAILLERESLSANYPEVKELDDEDDPFRGICAQSWSCAVTELNREQHSWQFLEQAVNELHLGIGDCNYLCRSLLDWFTMRLLRDLKVRAVREPHSGKDFTDEHHEHHVRAIASSFTDEASEAILKHAISVCRLLSTVYRYTPPDPNREPYTGMDYELKWLWLNTNDILKLHDNPTIENFCDGELQFNLLLAPSLERGFWNACWDQLRLADQQSELLQPSPSAPIDMEFLMVMTFEKLRYHNVVQNHQHFIHDLQCTLRLARRLRRYEISQFGGVLPQDENMVSLWSHIGRHDPLPWKTLCSPVTNREFQRAIVRLLALICRYADAAGRSNRAWVHDSPEKRALQLMAFYQETEDAAPPVESLVRHVARVVRFVERNQRPGKLMVSNTWEGRDPRVAVAIWIWCYRPSLGSWLRAWIGC